LERLSCKLGDRRIGLAVFASSPESFACGVLPTKAACAKSRARAIKMIKRFMVILQLPHVGAIQQMALSQVSERRRWEAVEIYRDAGISRSVSWSHNNRDCIMHHKMLALVAGAAISALMLAPDTVSARDGLRQSVRGNAIGAYRSATLRSRRGVVGCCAALG
jgi:hypothetical protein